MRNWTGCS